MFTLAALYIFFYVLTLAQIMWFCQMHNLAKNVTQMSFTNVWKGTSIYISRGWVLKFLIIQLSGLPPVFVFFIKINLIALTLKLLSPFLQVIIFINLLLSMFFYLQIFSTTNATPSKELLKDLLQDTSMVDSTKWSYNKNKYNFYLFFTSTLFFSLFSFIFFFDLFVIIIAFLY